MTGLELKEKRKILKWSQEKLADKAGVTKRTVINWEQSEELSNSIVNILHHVFNVKSENYDSENFEEQNLALEPESSYPGNLHKLAYESILFFDELMTIKQYKAFFNNKLDLELNKFKDLKELEKYINR